MDEVDWWLQTMIRMVERDEGIRRIGVTLVCRGAIVSGELITERAYMEGFVQEFVGALSVSEESRLEFQRLLLEATDAGRDEAARNAGGVFSFIHIAGARFYSPGQQPIPTNRGVFWRGRICDVSGFSLGSLSSD